MLVHEISRTAFEQLITNHAVVTCRIDELVKAKPEYVVVSSWAEFGRYSGIVYIRSKHTNDEAIAWAQELEDCTMFALINGFSKLPDEYEVWHVVDDEQPIVEDETVITYSVYLFNKNDECIGEIDIDNVSDGYELAEKLIDNDIARSCHIAAFDGENVYKLAYIDNKKDSIKKTRSLARKALSQDKPCHDEDGRKPYHLLLSFPEEKTDDEWVDVSGETQALKCMQEDGYDWDGFYDWCKSPACKKLIDACTLAMSDLGVLD